MKTLSITAISLSLLAGASVAQADEVDPSQFAAPAATQRTRDEVRQEAVQAVRSRSTEPAGSRVAAAPEGRVSRAQLSAEAALAVRLGRISIGEAGI